MAVNKVYKFTDISLLQYFLNGAVIGGMMPISNGQAGWTGLVGKTLILSSPAAHTCTFATGSGPDPYILTMADVKAQVEAANSGAVHVVSTDGKLVLIEAVPTSGVAVAAAGTANPTLGFDKNHPTAGKLFTPPGTATPTAPAWTWAYSVNENMHVLFTLEAS